MKGHAGRATRSSSDKPKHPEDVPKTLPRKSIPKATVVDAESEEEDELEEDEAPRKSAGPREKEKKKVAFEVPSKPAETPKKPSSVPYVMVPPLRTHEKVKPKARKEPMPVIEKRQPAYKLRAPIEDEVKAEEILKQLEDQKIEITQGQLLGISTAGFRRKFVEKIIPRRVPLDLNTMRILQLDYDEEEWVVDDVIAELAEEDTEEEFMRMDALPVATYLVLPEDRHGMKKGTIIMEDPYEQYVATLQPGEKRKGLVVARESDNLKAVFPLINGKGHAETLLDSGSQIVAMSQANAERLSLSWDPEFTVRMQSANKQVETTKGLARNVPFVFGDLTLYLQVHILSAPAYDVLLGKPFEVLTESNVKTRSDGTVELTITDPNTKRKLVVPTYDRGCGPKIIQREPRGPESVLEESPVEPSEQNFQSSMS